MLANSHSSNWDIASIFPYQTQYILSWIMLKFSLHFWHGSQNKIWDNSWGWRQGHLIPYWGKDPIVSFWITKILAFTQQGAGCWGVGTPTKALRVKRDPRNQFLRNIYSDAPVPVFKVSCFPNQDLDPITDLTWLSHETSLRLCNPTSYQILSLLLNCVCSSTA